MVDSAYKGGALLTNNAFKGGAKAAATTLGKFKNAAKAAGKAVPLLNIGVEAYLGNANYQSAVNLIDHFVSEGAITQTEGLAILDEALSDQATNSAWSASVSTVAGVAGTAAGGGGFPTGGGSPPDGSAPPGGGGSTPPGTGLGAGRVAHPRPYI